MSKTAAVQLTDIDYVTLAQHAIDKPFVNSCTNHPVASLVLDYRPDCFDQPVLHQYSGPPGWLQTDIIINTDETWADYHKTKHFRWWNVFADMCRMGRWSFWSWFDVNRSTFDKDVSEKNDCYIFVPSDLRLWPPELKFGPLVTLVQGHVSTKLKVSTVFPFRENRKHETTDGQTDWRGATCGPLWRTA